MINIKEIIKPETELEETIINDSEFVEGALWGKPRKGHPEGMVIYHIRDVLTNISKYGNKDQLEKLRLIALIHDTFKHKVDVTKPKTADNHHAVIARKFAEKYITDNEILEIIELHDEAYNSWCKGDRDNDWFKAENRAKKLINRLGDSMDLYLTFYMCDNLTGDKKSTDYAWFVKYYELYKL